MIAKLLKQGLRQGEVDALLENGPLFYYNRLVR